MSNANNIPNTTTYYLIRSRTLEAFFPLIAVAAIYFALCCVFAWIINKLIDRVDYDKRPRRIKGVNEGA